MKEIKKPGAILKMSYDWRCTWERFYCHGSISFHILKVTDPLRFPPDFLGCPVTAEASTPGVRWGWGEVGGIWAAPSCCEGWLGTAGW